MEALRELVRELRQSYGLGASFFRAAATRIEMTDTDVQVMDLLESTGEASAGQLADLMGLTTGTFAGILNRLEKAGLVRRERDPADGRRVIVRLATSSGGRHEIDPLFAPIGKAWEEMAAHYDDEQRTLLLEFLQRSNALARQEIARLREVSEGTEGLFSAPLAGLESARLVFPTGAFRLTLRAGDVKDALYQARFEGSVPEVKTREGVVTIRYPRRLWVPSREKRSAEVALSSAIPWQIMIQGGAWEMSAELGGLHLTAIEIKGGLHAVHLNLPTPSGVVPMQISGGASEVIVRRPAGVAARVHLKGWASGFMFDDQTFSAVGNDVRLQSQGFDPATPYYDIEVASSASQLTINSG
ncbi:MAG TPA: MarR family transcriptional regulator [Ktedonobacterales bacterium]|jgi:DNA-binding MarR family transcriptional regulator